MPRRFILLVLLLSLLPLLPASVSAAETGEGIIEGQLINGTENGGSVENQEIILTPYLDDISIETRSTFTDPEGSFLFSELPTGAGYSYDVALYYQEAEYHSERLVFAGDSYVKSIVLDVYDATENPEAIQIEMAHIIIYVEPGILHVEEYLIFFNESDHAYIGTPSSSDESTRETLKFSLPEGASELQISHGLMDCCITSTENGLVDSMAVLPGPKEIVYSYHIYLDSKKYVFSEGVNYPIKNLTLLIQGDNIDISSEQLFASEPLSVEGTAFNHLSGNNIARDEVISIRLSNLPVTGNSANIIWLAFILAIPVIGFLFVFALRRRKLGVVVPPGHEEQSDQGALTELAQLDDDFEDGKIDEEVYRRLRAEKKSQLMQSAKYVKGNTGNQ